VIEVDAGTQTYTPHVWFNDFWLLRDYLVGGCGVVWGGVGWTGIFEVVRGLVLTIHGGSSMPSCQ